jgi:hypothetical protein
MAYDILLSLFDPVEGRDDSKEYMCPLEPCTSVTEMVPTKFYLATLPHDRLKFYPRVLSCEMSSGNNSKSET